MWVLWWFVSRGCPYFASGNKCGILHEWNHYRLKFYFVNCWCSVLHLLPFWSGWWHWIIMVTLQKTSHWIQAGEAFLSAFTAVKEALIFICTWIFCVCWQPQLQTAMMYYSVLTGRLVMLKKYFYLHASCSVAVLLFWMGSKFF